MADEDDLVDDNAEDDADEFVDQDDNILKIGDQVMASSGSMNRAIVIGFTKTLVKIRYKESGREGKKTAYYLTKLYEPAEPVVEVKVEPVIKAIPND